MTPAVSMLVSSRSDQSSWAGNPLSAFTEQFCKILSGETAVDTSKKFLTLADIVGHIPAHTANEEGQTYLQELAHFTVNVLGPPIVCENPLVDSDKDQPHSPLLSPYSALGKAALKKKTEIDEFHRSISTKFSHEKLIKLVRPIADSASTEPEELSTLFTHYYEWLRDANSSMDWSIPFRIAGALNTASLSALWQSDTDLFVVLQNACNALEFDLAFLENCLDEDFITESGILHPLGVDVFYWGPLHVSDIYGRFGLMLMAKSIGLCDKVDINSLSRIITWMVEKLPAHHVILNESQAPSLALFFEGCARHNLLTLAEQPFGLYANDHWSTKGIVLRDDFSNSQVAAYLRARAENQVSNKLKGIARPNTVLPVLLLSANLLGFEDTLDIHLRMLNGITTSLYVVKNGKNFGQAIMENGINITLSVGGDFYTCSEYGNALLEMIGDDYDRTTNRSFRGFSKCISAQLFRDRIAIDPEFIANSICSG